MSASGALDDQSEGLSGLQIPTLVTAPDAQNHLVCAVDNQHTLVCWDAADDATLKAAPAQYAGEELGFFVSWDIKVHPGADPGDQVNRSGWGWCSAAL